MTPCVYVPDALRGSWTSWLAQRPWDLMVTLTSSHRTHPEALVKRLRYCLHLMANGLYGRAVTRRRNPIEYVCGIERHKSGWPHSHSLVRFPGVDLRDPSQLSLAVWQPRITDTGGWCRLDRPRVQGDVVGYCTKYVVKGGELVLSDNLSPSIDRTPELPLTFR